MPDLKMSRLDEHDVTALYRRCPGAPAPQRCMLTLDLGDGSLSAGHEEPSSRTSDPVRAEDCVAGNRVRGRVLCWPIPCLTAEGANQVLDTLAPLAGRILAGASWNDRQQVFALNDAGAVAASQVTRLCNDIGLIVDLTDEVVHEQEARDWFAETPGELVQEYGITAGTTGEQLHALTQQLEHDCEHGPNVRPVVVVRGIQEYLTEIREGLRAQVAR